MTRLSCTSSPPSPLTFNALSFHSILPGSDIMAVGYGSLMEFVLTTVASPVIIDCHGRVVRCYGRTSSFLYALEVFEDRERITGHCPQQQQAICMPTTGRLPPCFGAGGFPFACCGLGREDWLLATRLVSYPPYLVIAYAHKSLRSDSR